MRKGLIVTLGVVALLLAVTPGFTFAPVISCIPDILVSDYESNQTAPNNFFVFSDALNLDDQVRDDDTTRSLLKWSFVETAPGTSILINGKGSLTPPTVANLKDPGAFNLRAVGPTASIRNNRWSPNTSSPPYPAPGAAGATTTSMVQLVVSDGTAYTSQAVTIRTYHTASPPTGSDLRDGVTPQNQKSWTFNSGQESWIWFTQTGLPAPTNLAAGGRLEMTMTPDGATPRPIVFGAWESPKNPAAAGALHARFGCVMRARYRMSSSVSGMLCPGVRMRGWWTRVILDPVLGYHIPDFYNADFNDLYEQNITTLDVLYVTGREPGTAGKTYTLLYYPQQIDTLMTTAAIVYFTCDLLDDDYPGANDAGSLFLDQVDVDGFDRPEIGATGMTSVPAMSYTNFSTGWDRFGKKLDVSATTATVTATASASGLSISCGAGTSLWEYGFATRTGVPLVNGRYYRARFVATSSQTPGGDAVPTLRTGFISTMFSAFANKRLEGGGTYSSLSSTGEDYEMWYAAPTNLVSTSATEPFTLRFEAYVLFQPNLLGKNIAGTVGCRSVATESMLALP